MAGRPGRKPKMTLEERIEQITKDIETYKKSINTLEEQREELIKQKRERDLSELYEVMEDNNLSVDDVKLMIESNNTEKAKLEVI